jgi:hypothetical protein
MLHPTPTCTRFQITIKMPCLKCGNGMRLSLIEPCSGQNLERLTSGVLNAIATKDF